jgi:hypothetical protein
VADIAAMNVLLEFTQFHAFALINHRKQANDKLTGGNGAQRNCRPVERLVSFSPW